MSTKPAIKPGEIPNHFSTGLTTSRQDEKYQLSSKSVISLCSKLIEAKEGADADIEDQIPLAQDRMDFSQKRALLRNYLLVHLKIHQASDPDVQGLVLDITDNGLQVSGMRASLGETKTFVIPASEIAGSRAFSFHSECRWSIAGHVGCEALAGFKITSISARNSEELGKLIRSLTIGD